MSQIINNTAESRPLWVLIILYEPLGGAHLKCCLPNDLVHITYSKMSCHTLREKREEDASRLIMSRSPTHDYCSLCVG